MIACKFSGITHQGFNLFLTQVTVFSIIVVYNHR